MVVSKIYDYFDNENLFILITILNKYLDISIYLDNRTPLPKMESYSIDSVIRGYRVYTKIYGQLQLSYPMLQKGKF